MRTFDLLTISWPCADHVLAVRWPGAPIFRYHPCWLRRGSGRRSAPWPVNMAYSWFTDSNGYYAYIFNPYN